MNIFWHCSYQGGGGGGGAYFVLQFRCPRLESAGWRTAWFLLVFVFVAWCLVLSVVCFCFCGSCLGVVILLLFRIPESLPPDPDSCVSSVFVVVPVISVCLHVILNGEPNSGK